MRSHRLSGQFTLDLPPAEAFPLFTARGERAWVTGWEPMFPVPTEDDAAVGTVFETDAHGQRTVWMVVDSQPPRRIRYAQVRLGERAGTVSVAVDNADGGSVVTVTYELTPLTEAAVPELDRFAAHYPTFLDGWSKAIATRMDASA